MLSFVGVLIFALLSFGLGWVDTLTATQKAKQSVNDLNRVSNARALGELFYYNQVPTGESYSIHQRSFELAKRGGGQQIRWTEQQMDDEAKTAFKNCGTNCGASRSTTSKARTARKPPGSAARFRRMDRSLHRWMSSSRFPILRRTSSSQ
jgi:hypothetical protein